MSAALPPAQDLLPGPAEVRAHLAGILARGSVNLGAAAGTERLMLMLTRSCELRCSYCQVQKTEVGQEMSVSTALAAVDLIMRSARPRLELQLFGGEPTRSWPVIQAAVHHAVAHPARQGRKLEVILTTNGLGLDPARIAWLGDHGAMVLFSLDGDARAHHRYRPVHRPSDGDPAAVTGALDLDDDVAWGTIDATVGDLLASSTPWFMNATLPPAAAGEVEARYAWARQRGVPRLQLNYAVGMLWSPRQVDRYLLGLIAAMRRHRERGDDLVLFNWKSECEPVMLSDDLIVDVDGTVLHDGAIFLERALPELKRTYARGHLDSLIATEAGFDPLRWSLAQLAEVMLGTYPPDSEQRAIVQQNIELGAAVDLVIRRLRAEGQPAAAAGGRG